MKGNSPLRLSALLFLVFLSICPMSKADIGLLLNGSVNAGASELTSAGHAAVYLSRICPVSPVELRLCHPGEQGSVIGTYPSFGEREPAEWNVVPLSIFLYGVEDAADAPLIATLKVREALQDSYRLKHMREVCDDPACATSRKAHWRDLIGEAFVRETYAFEVRTSVEQDEQFIASFNARPNVNRYNGLTNNCADFAMTVVNMYFPRAAKPDHVNDFGITSPKAIARSFTHFAEKHPELHFHVVRYAQLPGDFKHSADCRKGTEVAFRSKKWFFPMLLRSNELLLFTASYLLTGRFNPNHELQRRPSERAGDLLQEIKAGKSSSSTPREYLEAQLIAERKIVLGTDSDWDKYRDHFEELLDSAIANGLVAYRGELKNLVRDLGKAGRAYVDLNGSLWMEVNTPKGARKVGISSQTIFSPGSDRELASRLLLARIDFVLRERTNYREALPDFSSKWALLQAAIEENTTIANGASGASGSASAN